MDDAQPPRAEYMSQTESEANPEPVGVRGWGELHYDADDNPPRLLGPSEYGGPYDLPSHVQAPGDQGAAELPAKRSGQLLGTLREILETVVLALLIFLAVRSVVQNFRVEGSSMFPNFVDGQYVLVNKAVYARVDLKTLSKWIPFIHAGSNPEVYIFHPPRRGDVIVFHPPPPNIPTRDFIKRVVGVPGDTIDVRAGKVFVNGGEVIAPYINQRTDQINPCYSHVTLAKDQFFVMGDNRGNSSDSRSWGPVSADAIVGRTWLVYWPSKDWKIAPNHTENVPPPSAEPVQPQPAAAACGRGFGD